MNDDLKKPELRAIQYWLVDGVGELFVGFIFLLAVIVYYLQELSPGSLLSRVLGITSVILVCGGAFGGRWIIQRIKERTTYPRTGYVAYKSGWKNKRDVAIAIGYFADGVRSNTRCARQTSLDITAAQGTAGPACSRTPSTATPKRV